MALELAARHPRALGGVVLVDGGITSMREGFATWAEARTALSPPHLAGTPVEEFRAMIPMFFGDAVEVTPEVEDIVLAVMRVGPDGTIRPRLIACEPPPDPARHLGAGSARAACAAAHAALAILARGGDADWDVAVGRPLPCSVRPARPRTPPGWTASTICRCSIPSSSHAGSEPSPEPPYDRAMFVFLLILILLAVLGVLGLALKIAAALVLGVLIARRRC